MEAGTFRVLEYKQWTTIGIQIHYEVERSWKLLGFTRWKRLGYYGLGDIKQYKFEDKGQVMSFIESLRFHPTIVDYITI